ncbi:MAG: hypothetical protein NUW37_01705 [Planctomycetes bacterium]|nr:hypothetical protein [Planctomycetota bacterium]
MCFATASFGCNNKTNGGVTEGDTGETVVGGQDQSSETSSPRTARAASTQSTPAIDIRSQSEVDMKAAVEYALDELADARELKGGRGDTVKYDAYRREIQTGMDQQVRDPFWRLLGGFASMMAFPQPDFVAAQSALQNVQELIENPRMAPTDKQVIWAFSLYGLAKMRAPSLSRTDHQEGVKLLEDALSTMNGYWRFLVLKASLHVQMNQVGLAGDAMTKAAVDGAGKFDYYVEAFYHYNRAGRKDLAEESLRKAEAEIPASHLDEKFKLLSFWASIAHSPETDYTDYIVALEKAEKAIGIELTGPAAEPGGKLAKMKIVVTIDVAFDIYKLQKNYEKCLELISNIEKQYPTLLAGTFPGIPGWWSFHEQFLEFLVEQGQINKTDVLAFLREDLAGKYPEHESKEDIKDFIDWWETAGETGRPETEAPIGPMIRIVKDTTKSREDRIRAFERFRDAVLAGRFGDETFKHGPQFLDWAKNSTLPMIRVMSIKVIGAYGSRAEEYLGDLTDLLQTELAKTQKEYDLISNLVNEIQKLYSARRQPSNLVRNLVRVLDLSEEVFSDDDYSETVSKDVQSADLFYYATNFLNLLYPSSRIPYGDIEERARRRDAIAAWKRHVES